MISLYLKNNSSDKKDMFFFKNKIKQKHMIKKIYFSFFNYFNIYFDFLKFLFNKAHC
jgi:hypothetical protein